MGCGRIMPYGAGQDDPIESHKLRQPTSQRKMMEYIIGALKVYPSGRVDVSAYSSKDSDTGYLLNGLRYDLKDNSKEVGNKLDQMSQRLEEQGKYIETMEQRLESVQSLLEQLLANGQRQIPTERKVVYPLVNKKRDVVGTIEYDLAA